MTDLLLDTHALLWFDTNPELVPEPTLELIRNCSVRVYVSAVTAWELAIKHRFGKLPEAAALLRDYGPTLQTYGFAELAFTGAHALRDLTLEHPHKDPFDRALVAQALSEQFVVVSKDPAVAAFPGVTVVWA